MRLRYLTAVFATVVLLIVGGFPATGFAQDQQGASVVILKFERFNASDAAMSILNESLENVIEDHPDMYVKSGGEVTVNDLALTAGCAEPNAECLVKLRDMLDADRIVFGSLQQSEDVYLITMKMFDFAEGRFIREVSDQTIQGDLGTFERAAPAVIEGFLYGKVGTVQVNVEGADSPEVFFDGEKVGIAPTTLENLPLGEHVVTVKTRDGEEQSEKLLLRHDEPASVDFEFEPAVEVVAPKVSEPTEGPSAAPGWIAIGVGALGAGLGVWGIVEENRVDDDIAALCAEGNPAGNICTGDDAAFATDNQRQQFESLEDEGSTAKTLQLVGFSVAGAGVVVGSLLLYRAYSHEEAPAEGTAVRFGVAPRSGGFTAGFSAEF